MNKTLHINLTGLIFHIDEDAYHTLEQYLKSIKIHLQKEEGASEILQDIESRIAELFRQWKGKDEVVGQEEVVRMKSILGKPEEYLSTEEQEGEAASQKKNEQEEATSKKLFRNPEDKKIFGVCGGIATYLDIDSLWIRLAVIALIVFFIGIDSGLGGSMIIIYIVLMILIPEAKTTAQRLQMKGKSINIQNIKSSFEDLAENVQNEAKTVGPHIQALGKGIERVAQFLWKGFMLSIGVIILGGALLLSVTLFSFILALIGDNFYFIRLFDRVVLDGWESVLLGIVVFFVWSALIVLLLMLGLTFISRRIKWPKTLALGLIVTIGTGIIICGGLAWNYFNEAEMVNYKGTPTDYPVEYSGDTIRLNLNKWEEDGYVEHNHWFNNLFEKKFKLDEQNNLQISFDEISIKIKPSEDQRVYLKILRESNGESKEKASTYAKTIIYNVNVQDSIITMDDYYTLPQAVPYREQKIIRTLYLPIGKTIVLKNSYDLSRDDNTLWIYPQEHGKSSVLKMTNQGLVCLDCTEDNHDEEVIENAEELIKIDEEGIIIKSDDGQQEIIMNDQGMRIKNGEKEIIMNDTGIHQKRMNHETKESDRDTVKITHDTLIQIP